MKESYREILARYSGPESYADQGNLLGVATAGVQLGRVIEFRNPHQFVRRHPGTIGTRLFGDNHKVRIGKKTLKTNGIKLGKMTSGCGCPQVLNSLTVVTTASIQATHNPTIKASLVIPKSSKLPVGRTHISHRLSRWLRLHAVGMRSCDLLANQHSQLLISAIG